MNNSGTADIPARWVGVDLLWYIARGFICDQNITGAFFKDVEFGCISVALVDDGSSSTDHVQGHASEDCLPCWEGQHVKQQISFHRPLCQWRANQVVNTLLELSLRS